MIMTRVFQFLTIINLAGLILLGLFWFKTKEPSQSAVPAPTAGSSSARSITPMSTPPATNPTPMAVNNPMAVIKGEPGKPQTVDVLTGDAIDRNLYGDYDGKRVYFCHPGSKTRFESNAAENLQKIKEKGIVLEKAPVR
jgi:hypothetical protein